MNCEQARRWIIDDLVEPLDDERREQLRLHLAECPACAAEAAEYVALWDDLSAAAVEPTDDAPRDPTPERRERDGDAGKFEPEDRAWMPLLRKAATAVLLIGLGAVLGSAARSLWQPEEVAPAQGNRYLLIMTRSAPPAELAEQARQEIDEWFDQLSADGVVETGFGFPDESLVGTPPDGPWIPPNISGIMIIRASSPEEARRITAASPIIRYGGFIELHAIN